MNYEMLVIGNGSEAVRGAIAAARRGLQVALVEPASCMSDAVSTEILKEAAGSLTGRSKVRMSELRAEVDRVARCRRAADRAEMECLGVDVYGGDARFLDEQTVEIRQTSSLDFSLVITADETLLAVGTRSAHPRHINFDGQTVIDVESLLKLDTLPESMIVVGAGDVGLDYALILRSLGIEVTVIDEKSSLFELCDNLMSDTRLFEAQSLDIAFRLGDEVIAVERHASGQAIVRSVSGKSFVADVALICVGRVGETNSLNLEVTGVGIDERGKVWCDADGATWARHIKATGEVVGFRGSTTLAG